MPRWALTEGATPSPLKVRITNCWPALICALEYKKYHLCTHFFIEFSFSGLSGDLSVFFETLKTMSDNNKADVPSDDFQIQTFDAAQQDELISVADSAADASMAYIQQEYSDLSSKYQMVLKMLEEEQKQRARNQQEHENRERLLEEQLETLRQQFNEFTTASNSTADADGKLEKLKVRFTYPLFLLDELFSQSM